MRIGQPNRPAMPAALLGLAWLTALATCITVAWDTFPRGQYQPPTTNLFQALGRALSEAWPTQFTILAAAAGLVLFPLTWLTLEPPYRRTIPLGFGICAIALGAAYLHALPRNLNAFAVSTLFGVLAIEGYAPRPPT